MVLRGKRIIKIKTLTKAVLVSVLLAILCSSVVQRADNGSSPFVLTTDTASNQLKDNAVPSQEPTASSWHHDCSNTTGFVSKSSWNVDFYTDWTIASGTLTSSGTELSFSGILSGTLWHGPVYVYELSEPFKLNCLSKLEVQYDVDNAMAGDAGVYWAYLADSVGNPIVTTRVEDYDGSARLGNIVAEYRTSDNSVYSHGGEDVTFTSFQGSMSVLHDGSNIVANVTGYGSSPVYSPSTEEGAREIRYVVLQGGRYVGESLMPGSYLDIALEYSIPTWVDGFPYRKNHTIYGSPGAGAGYQVEIKVHSGLGVDSGNLVNLLPGHWNPTDPIRFTDDDGFTLLDYWMEWSDEDDAVYWVQVLDNLDTDCTIFVYYGNRTEPSLSSGTDTFIFFDDFENNNFGRWDTAGSYWSTNSSLKKYGSYSAWYNGTLTSGQGNLLEINITNTENFMIHLWEYVPDRGVNQEGVLTREVFANGQQGYSLRTIATTSGDKLQYYQLPSGMLDWPGGGITVNSWFRFELGVEMNSETRVGYLNRNLMANLTYADLAGGTVSDTALDTFRLYGQSVYGDLVVNPVHVDDIYIRKWISPEPIHGSWEGEEDNLNITGGQFWLPDFPFRRNHTIYGSPGAGVNYQVKIQVHSGTGVDSGSLVNLNISHWTVADPIRFTSSDGVTLLDYYREYNDTTNAFYWIKISENLDNDVVIWIYYGNSTAPDLSNGTNTFLFFDNFENNNLDRWDYVGTGWNTATLYAIRGDYVAWLATTGGRDLYKTINITTGCRIHVWGYLSGNPSPTVKAWDESTTEVILMDMMFDTGLRYYQSAWYNWPGSNSINPGQWYELSIGIDFANAKMRGWKGASYLGEVNLADYNGASVSSFTRIGLAGASSALVDDYYITKWIPIEPLHASWGDEMTDAVQPEISQPEDLSYSEFSINNEISWYPYDLYPRDYWILMNESQIQFGSWNSSLETVTINIDGLGLGVYNYTLVVRDCVGNIAMDGVLVEVSDGTSPIINNQVDVMYDEGEMGVSISWNPTDYHPSSYQIILDGSQVKSGLWNSSGETITIGVSGLSIGDHNCTLVVWDIGGNSDIDEVWITVSDGTNPLINDISDFSYDENSIGNTIIWDPSDSHPSSYQILRNGLSIASGPWNSTLETITIDIDGLELGLYNFTVVVTDIGGNLASDTVMVEVVDGTNPTIDSPEDVEYDEGTTGYSIEWSPSDAHPIMYEIFQNGISIASGLWNSSLETISISVDGLPFGIHNYTIVVTDIGNNVAIGTVIVSVHDATQPTIDEPADRIIESGSTGNSILWTPMDINPYSYEILLNGTPIKSGVWNSSAETIGVSVDYTDLGFYNFTIIVYDEGGNPATDTVIVNVVDTTPPSINHPLNFSYNEGELNKIITWAPLDLHPYSYEVYRNHTLVGFGPWDGSQLVIPVSGLADGLWNITIVVIDTTGNTISDTVMVTVFPSSTTSTTTTTTTTATTTTSANTTTPGDPFGTVMVLAASAGGAILFVALIAVYLLRKRSTGAAGPATRTSDIEALRGGEFVGNRLRFKVKIVNNSKQVITDVCVTLTSYPKESLKLEGEPSRTIAKLESKGFRSPTFEFLPTKDCVKGDIIATISWVDANGQAHSTTTKPYTVRAVCDLLQPESISPDDFILKLATLGHGESITKVDDWTPEEMHEKTIQILKDSNFFEVTSAVTPVGEYTEISIQGWAKGMYTGKNLGVQITITGRPAVKGATCKVRVSGEDEAMILPAIDEISQKLGAWLCPKCGGALPEGSVKQLKDGKSVACPFCGVTMDR